MNDKIYKLNEIEFKKYNIDKININDKNFNDYDLNIYSNENLNKFINIDLFNKKILNINEIKKHYKKKLKYKPYIYFNIYSLIKNENVLLMIKIYINDINFYEYKTIYILFENVYNIYFIDYIKNYENKEKIKTYNNLLLTNYRLLEKIKI